MCSQCSGCRSRYDGGGGEYLGKVTCELYAKGRRALQVAGLCQGAGAGDGCCAGGATCGEVNRLNQCRYPRYKRTPIVPRLTKRITGIVLVKTLTLHTSAVTIG